MEKRALFEPGDLIKTFTGDFGLVISGATFEGIKGKVKQGRNRLADFADNRQYWGHAFGLLRRAESFLMDHVHIAGRIVPGKMISEDQPWYPPRATREALANGLCHRDYTIPGGANVVCFTTGRGTVCGFKPVPTIKLASNTEMYRRLSSDIDINCGLIVDGDATIQKTGEDIFRLILETASGKKTKSEILDFGENEFAPWNIGPVM